MADNVTLNAGSGGETCATDDVSGVQYQIVKLADGTANASTVIAAAGGVEANALRVTIASDSTGVLSVDDNGGSLTVDNNGTFAVQAVCTNAGTFAVQESGALLTAAQLLDDVVYVDDADWTALTSKHALIGGVYNVTPRVITDGDTAPMALDSSGHVIVNQHSANITLSDGTSNAPNLAVDDDDEAIYAGSFGFLYNGTTWDRMKGDATNGLLVNLGSNNDVTITSGTISLPSGASTLAEQQTQTTALQLIDDAIYIDDADWTALTSKHALVGGVYTSAARTITDGDTAPFSIDVNGHTIVSPHGASTALADNVSNTINLIVDQSNGFTAMATVGYMFDGSTWDRIRGTSADGLLVNLGTNNDVTITSGTVTTVTTVSTVTTLSTLTGGAVAHDSADSGNPIKVGAKASATLSDDTMVANADRTDLTSDLDGAIITRPQFPLGDLITERVSNTDGSSTAFTNFAATASARNYVYGYSIFRTDSGTTPIYVDFRDGTAGSILWSVVIPPNGGANLSSPVPLFRTTANTALAYDVSAATTTVYISINGCKSKV